VRVFFSFIMIYLFVIQQKLQQVELLILQEQQQQSENTQFIYKLMLHIHLVNCSINSI